MQEAAGVKAVLPLPARAAKALTEGHKALADVSRQLQARPCLKRSAKNFGVDQSCCCVWIAQQLC